jgi:hypothetical protein
MTLSIKVTRQMTGYTNPLNLLRFAIISCSHICLQLKIATIAPVPCCNCYGTDHPFGADG